MGSQVTLVDPQTGAVTGGYSTPYTVTVPIRDRSSHQGLYLFTNEEDSLFRYTPPPWYALTYEPYNVFQYVDLLSGKPKPLDGLNFPCTGNMTPPAQTPLVRMLNYSHGTPWYPLMATDITGNYYVYNLDNTLGIYQPDGSYHSYPWDLYSPPYLIQMLWSPTGHLYNAERSYQGVGVSGTFKDVVYKYDVSGHSIGAWYTQINFLHNPAPDLPVPGVMFDVGSDGNIYGLDTSNMTLFARAGSPFSRLYTVPFPSGTAPACAFCLCESLGYLAVLCCADGAMTSVFAQGANNGLPVWDVNPPFAACTLYLFDMHTGSQVASYPLPAPLVACPEVGGLVFCDPATLLVVDKFNGYTPPGCTRQLAACRDQYGTLHVLSVNNGNLQYTRANPADGPLASSQPLGTGGNPSLLWTGSQLRAAYQDAAGDYVVHYSADGGKSWSL